MTNFNFLDTGKITKIKELTNFGFDLKHTPPNLEDNELFKDNNKNSFFKNLLTDNKSINLLQSHITTCLNIHNDVLFNHLPPEINIKFLHINYLMRSSVKKRLPKRLLEKFLL